jgi:hypothetical protein
MAHCTLALHLLVNICEHFAGVCGHRKFHVPQGEADRAFINSGLLQVLPGRMVFGRFGRECSTKDVLAGLAQHIARLGCLDDWTGTVNRISGLCIGNGAFEERFWLQPICNLWCRVTREVIAERGTYGGASTLKDVSKTTVQMYVLSIFTGFVYVQSLRVNLTREKVQCMPPYVLPQVCKTLADIAYKLETPSYAVRLGIQDYSIGNMQIKMQQSKSCVYHHYILSIIRLNANQSANSFALLFRLLSPLSPSKTTLLRSKTGNGLSVSPGLF